MDNYPKIILLDFNCIRRLGWLLFTIILTQNVLGKNGHAYSVISKKLKPFGYHPYRGNSTKGVWGGKRRL